LRGESTHECAHGGPGAGKDNDVFHGS
jgi:hypothetical protein